MPSKYTENEQIADRMICNLPFLIDLSPMVFFCSYLTFMETGSEIDK